MQTFVTLALAAVAAAQQTPNLTAALSSTPELSQLTRLLSGFPAYLQQLGSASNVTILAPSDAAFAKVSNSSALGQAIARNDSTAIVNTVNYHIINGSYLASAIPQTFTFVPTHLTSPAASNVTGGQRVGLRRSGNDVTAYSGLLTESRVTTANVNVTNNVVVHIIDTFLAPPANVSTTASDFGLSALVGALTSANLVSTLDTTPDLTIFAPNNTAFQRAASALTAANNDTVRSVLQYHVVAGNPLYAPTMNTTVQTLQGERLAITVINGAIFVNDAQVTVPHIPVANGVVHVIGDVLNPMATLASGTAPNPTSRSVAFSGASSASNVPFTSGVPAPSTTASVPASYVAAAGATGATGAAGSSTGTSSAAALPQVTGAKGVVGAGLLLAGAFAAL